MKKTIVSLAFLLLCVCTYAQMRISKAITVNTDGCIKPEGTLVQGCSKKITFSLKNTGTVKITRAIKLFITDISDNVIDVVWEQAMEIEAGNEISFCCDVPLTKKVGSPAGSYKFCMRADDTNDLSAIIGTSPIVPVLDGVNPKTISIVVDANCCPNTEIQKIEADDLKICPNPATNIVYLKHNGQMIDLVTIYDIAGKKVIENNLKNNNSIDISSLTKGMYILHLKANDKTVVQKFVKQ